MAATSGSGGMSGAILAALGAATVAGTITAAIVTAGAQHELNQQDCASPGDNLASQEVPTSSGGSGAGGTIDGIPPDYMDLYSSAASEYGLDVAILAAVGYVETKHGTAMGTSSAGAQGPMQFMPETWAAVGYDANDDGTADVWDPEDAIPSAAKYLRDSGAPEDYHGALFAYNHAEWYVQDVLAKADEYRASMGGGGDLALGGAAFPPAGDVAAGFGTLFRSAASPLGMRPAYATNGSEAVPAFEDEGIGEAVMPIAGVNRGSYTDGWGTTEGTEFRASKGTQVNSLVGGEVVRHNGSWGSVMVEADYAVGTVREGDLVFVSGLNGKDVRVGDRVSAGQSLGSAGTDGLHLGLYDPTGQRAESGSGAMNPFPMMNWLAENGGEASGVTATAPACENPDGAGGSAAPDGGGGGGGGTTSGSGSEVVAEAEKYLGVPYLLGGPEVCVPGETMDCTCLTTTVYAEFGYSLPDMPQGTLEYGEPVDEPAPGDLIVFPDPEDGTGGHVGIAAGGGEMIHACLPCGEVTYGPISGAGTPNGYRRLVG